ncbi:MAG: ribosome hibernation-promoting factor, HPF/YfiA family [Bacteroidota bacterium]|jgi:putative sigma-54 modulation protein
MQIMIQSIHFDADRKLIAYIQKRLEKLLTFYDNIIDASVYLKVEKSGDNNNKTLEVKLNVQNQTLFCEEHCRTFECAIDLAVESLKMQLKKYKDKLRAVNF